MQRSRIARFLAHAALVVLLVAVTVFNVMNLLEAYGSGPPYYSLTTNMDKWRDPRPVLGLVDATTIAVACLALRLLRR